MGSLSLVVQHPLLSKPKQPLQTSLHMSFLCPSVTAKFNYLVFPETHSMFSCFLSKMPTPQIIIECLWCAKPYSRHWGYSSKYDKQNPCSKEAHSPIKKTNKVNINKEVYVRLWLRSATKNRK